VLRTGARSETARRAASSKDVVRGRHRASATAVRVWTTELVEHGFVAGVEQSGQNRFTITPRVGTPVASRAFHKS